MLWESDSYITQKNNLGKPHNKEHMSIPPPSAAQVDAVVDALGGADVSRTQVAWLLAHGCAADAIVFSFLDNGDSLAPLQRAVALVCPDLVLCGLYLAGDVVA